MKQVVDFNNIPIPNTYRTDTGAIVVDDLNALNQSRLAIQRAESVSKLNNSVTVLEEKICHLENKMETFLLTIDKKFHTLKQILEDRANESTE